MSKSWGIQIGGGQLADRENDIEDFIAEAYLKTAEQMAASDPKGAGPG